MQHLNDLVNNTQTPFIYVALLGLLTAISPCQFARNITAVAYLGKDISDTRKVFINGLFYTFGNAAGYLSIGLLLFLGASKFHVSRILVSNSNLIIGIILIIVGLLMLDILKTRLSALDNLTARIQNRHYAANGLNATFLGFIFALSFCPYNAALFFGMIIPLTIAGPAGLYLPVVYSVTSALPVIIIAYLLAYSIAGIGTFYNRVKVFQVWFNRIVAVIFIVSGAYFILTSLI